MCTFRDDRLHKVFVQTLFGDTVDMAWFTVVNVMLCLEFAWYAAKQMVENLHGLYNSCVYKSMNKKDKIHYAYSHLFSLIATFTVF